MRICLALLLGLIAQTFVFGQLTETYFHDQEPKALGRAAVSERYGNHLIIGGTSFDRFLYQPSIIKVDLDGNVIWTTTTSDNSDYTGEFTMQEFSAVDRLLISDDKIYARCLVGFRRYELWKVDANTGAIEWKKRFGMDVMGIESLVDYDETRFLIGYAFSNDGFNYQTNISFIDKANGDVLTTLATGPSLWQTNGYGLAVDSHKDIYYTQDDNLFKLSGSNPYPVLWQTKNVASNILAFQRIYVDANDNIFAIGTQNSTWTPGKVLAFNKDNGQFLWEALAADGFNPIISDLVDDGTNLFVTWGQNSVGGADYKVEATKIEKLSGHIEWKSAYNYASLGSEAAFSITLDDSGDVLLTGYHGAANIGDGDWAFVKLDGGTGATEYGITITNNAAVENRLSLGIDAYFIDGVAYLVGNLQTYTANYYEIGTPVVVKFDPATQTILAKHYLYGNYIYPSRTTAIEKLNNSSVQLRQVGRSSVVELYDGDDLAWAKTLTASYALVGTHLAINADETITVAGFSTLPYYYYYGPPANDIPYFAGGETDSVHIFTLDKHGTLLASSGFVGEAPYATRHHYPLETLKDGNAQFLLHRNNEYLSITKIENGVVTTKELSQAYDLETTLLPGKRLLPYSATEIVVVDYMNAIGARVVKINKSNLNTTATVIPAPLGNIIHVEKLDNQTLMITGNGTYGDIVIKYDLNSMSMIYSKLYRHPTQTFPKADIYKFLFNQDKSAIYTMGVKADSVAIKKIAVATGDTLWTYYYNSPGRKEIPIDMDIDFTKNKLVIVGRSELIATPAAPNELFALTVTTDGKFNNIEKMASQFGKNAVSSIEILNSKMLIGGYLHRENRVDGFIYGGLIKDCAEEVSADITQADNTLIASENNANYQWVNCNTGLNIAGATAKTFTPTQSGAYSVSVSRNGCTRMSDCMDVTICDGVIQGVITLEQGHLEVSDENATYEWKSCDTGTSILGATQRTFTPDVSGNYKVTVRKNGCELTSACVSFTVSTCNDLPDAIVTQVDDHLAVSTTDGATYQWISCTTGLNVPGATLPNFTPTAAGTYKVTVTKSGCEVTSSCVSFTPTTCQDVLVAEVTQVEDHLVVSQTVGATYQWINCTTGLNVPGATLPNFTPTAADAYKVTVSKNACGVTTSCVPFTPTTCQDVLVAEITQVEDHLVVSQTVGATYQWIDCSTELDIPGAAGQTFTPTNTGDYKVRVSKGNCTSTAECVPFVITGIADVQVPEISLYPNPATNQVTIDFGRQLPGAKVWIRNLNGSVLLDQKIGESTRTTMSTENLPPGIYIMQVITDAAILVKKLVIE